MRVAPGSTDVTTYFHMRLAADNTAATGLTATDFDLQYTRSGAAAVAKVDATLNGNGVGGAHSNSTVIEVDATSSPGLYRVDWVDAAFAAAADEVILVVKVATAFTESLRVELDAQATTIASDLVLIYSDTTVIESDAAGLNGGNLTTIASDAAAIEAALGIATVSYSGGVALGGFLSRTIEEVRLQTDEPEINAKYSNGRVVTYIEKQWGEVWSDLCRMLARPYSATFDITVNSTSETWYPLPTYIRSILEIEIIDNAGNRLGRVRGRDVTNPRRPGVRVEGGMLIVSRESMQLGTIMRVVFVPSGSARLHEGTAQSVAADGSSATLATAPSLGALDTHPNAYVGCTFRVLSAGTNDYLQERPISAYNHVTLVASFPAGAELDPIPSGVVTYEIAPSGIDQTLDMVIAMKVAKQICSQEGNKDKVATLSQAYREAMRDIRLRAQELALYDGLMMRGDTADNDGYDSAGDYD